MTTTEPPTQRPEPALPTLERIEDLLDNTNPARLKLLSLLCTAVYSPSGDEAVATTLIQGYRTICGGTTRLLSKVLEARFVDGKIPLHWALSNMQQSPTQYARGPIGFIASYFVDPVVAQQLRPVVKALLEEHGPPISSRSTAKDDLELVCCERDDNTLYQLMKVYPLFGVEVDGFALSSPRRPKRQLDSGLEMDFRVERFLDKMIGGEGINGVQVIIHGGLYRFSFSVDGDNWVFAATLLKRVEAQSNHARLGGYMSRVYLSLDVKSSSSGGSGGVSTTVGGQASTSWADHLSTDIRTTSHTATIRLNKLRSRNAFIGGSRSLSGRIRVEV